MCLIILLIGLNNCNCDSRFINLSFSRLNDYTVSSVEPVKKKILVERCNLLFNHCLYSNETIWPSLLWLIINKSTYKSWCARLRCVLVSCGVSLPPMWSRLSCDAPQTDEARRWFVHQRLQQTPGSAVSAEIPGVSDREKSQVGGFQVTANPAARQLLYIYIKKIFMHLLACQIGFPAKKGLSNVAKTVNIKSHSRTNRQ